MNRTIHGTAHGKTIQLDEDPGLAEGQEVSVRVTALQPARQGGEGLQRCAGALEDEWTEEDDRILEEIHQERKSDCRREPDE